jgi:hypothetical protein
MGVQNERWDIPDFLLAAEEIDDLTLSRGVKRIKEEWPKER